MGIYSCRNNVKRGWVKILECLAGRNAAVIPERAEREPGIHNHERGLWIPARAEGARPGMTLPDIQVVPANGGTTGKNHEYRITPSSILPKRSETMSSA